MENRRSVFEVRAHLVNHEKEDGNGPHINFSNRPVGGFRTHELARVAAYGIRNKLIGLGFKWGEGKGCLVKDFPDAKYGQPTHQEFKLEVRHVETTVHSSEFIE